MNEPPDPTSPEARREPGPTGREPGPTGREPGPTGREPGLTRRELGRRGAAFALALAGLRFAPAARADDTAWVSDIPANESLLRGVQYVAQTEKPDQRCGNCVLYQPRGEARGKCALFQQGVVPEEAWCLSWSPKPA